MSDDIGNDITYTSGTLNVIKNYHTTMNVSQKEWDRIFGNPTTTRDISEVDIEYIENQQGRCL